MADSGWSWSPSRALRSFNLPSISNLNLPPPVPQTKPQTAVPLVLTPIFNSSSVPLPPMSAAAAAANPPPPPPPASKAAAATTATATATATATTKPPAATSRKRKSDANDVADKENLFPSDVESIDSDDDRLSEMTDSCNQVRRKIRNWTESGAMKVGEFQKAIGVSSKGYGSFMNRTGAWDGQGCDTYSKAHTFFKRRELQGLPLKAPKPKKAKTADAPAGKKAAAAKAADLFDVAGVTLPREAQQAVPVYDTCDEVRKKTRAFLAKDGVTQAAFVREISKTFTDGTTSVSPANLRYFMGRKGPLDGNTNVSFYAGYVFFEKQRLKANKPKTKFREEMEKAHGPKGVDTEHSPNGYITLLDGESAHIDKYGKCQIVSAGGRKRF